MEISNQTIIIMVVLMLITTGITIWNINTFMPIYEKCTDDFQMVNKCGCIPTSELADLFNYDLNYTGLPNYGK